MCYYVLLIVAARQLGMSARAAPLDRAFADSLGGAAYPCKPLGLKDFAAQVRALLDSKAQTKPSR